MNKIRIFKVLKLNSYVDNVNPSCSQNGTVENLATVQLPCKSKGLKCPVS